MVWTRVVPHGRRVSFVALGLGVCVLADREALAQSTDVVSNSVTLEQTDGDGDRVQVLAQRVQSQRGYDQIAARIFDRVALCQIGQCLLPGDDVSQASTDSSRSRTGAWLAYSFDKFKTDPDGGRAQGVDYHNVVFGVDTIFDEEVLLGANFGYQTYYNAGGYKDLAIGQADVFANQPRAVSRQTSYNGDHSESLDGLSASAYGAYRLKNGFGRSAFLKDSYVDAFFTYTRQDARTKRTADVVDLFQLVDTGVSPNVKQSWFQDTYSEELLQSFTQTTYNTGINATAVFKADYNTLTQAFTLGMQYFVVDKADVYRTTIRKDGFEAAFTPFIAARQGPLPDSTTITSLASAAGPLKSNYLSFQANYRALKSFGGGLSVFANANYQAAGKASQLSNTSFPLVAVGQSVVSNTATTATRALDKNFLSVDLGVLQKIPNTEMSLRVGAGFQVAPTELQRFGMAISLHVPFS
jgi:hypothetical protein